MRFAEDEQDEYEGIEGDCLIRKAQHKKVVIPLPFIQHMIQLSLSPHMGEISQGVQSMNLVSYFLYF